LLSQHSHAIRFWFGDRKQYRVDFGLMEEIVCIFGFQRPFRRFRRIGRSGRMEVFFEVFSSRQHLERDGENVTEAQFAPWRGLDACGPPKPGVATAPGGAADRRANRLREPHGNLMAELSSASTTRSSGGRSPLRWKAAMRFPVILAVAAFALVGCNANQAVNPSGQANLCANDPTCNPSNPLSYAQNNVGIGR
jgi:hypothetical protein